MEPGLVERRHQLTNLSASQRGQLMHDWVALKHTLSPSENIKRLSKPIGGGVLAVAGLTALFLLRKRLAILLWLPRLWRMRNVPIVSGLLRRFVLARSR